MSTVPVLLEGKNSLDKPFMVYLIINDVLLQEGKRIPARCGIPIRCTMEDLPVMVVIKDEQPSIYIRGVELKIYNVKPVD